MLQGGEKERNLDWIRERKDLGILSGENIKVFIAFT